MLLTLFGNIYGISYKIPSSITIKMLFSSVIEAYSLIGTLIEFSDIIKTESHGIKIRGKYTN